MEAVTNPKGEIVGVVHTTIGFCLATRIRPPWPSNFEPLPDNVWGKEYPSRLFQTEEGEEAEAWCRHDEQSKAPENAMNVFDESGKRVSRREFLDNALPLRPLTAEEAWNELHWAIVVLGEQTAVDEASLRRLVRAYLTSVNRGHVWPEEILKLLRDLPVTLQPVQPSTNEPKR